MRGPIMLWRLSRKFSVRGPIEFGPIPELNFRERLRGKKDCAAPKGCAVKPAVRCLTPEHGGKMTARDNGLCGRSAARQASACGLKTSVHGRRSKGHNSVRAIHWFTWPSTVLFGRAQFCPKTNMAEGLCGKTGSCAGTPLLYAAGHSRPKA